MTGSFHSRRICVVGTTGSGKSTLARELARRLQIPHIELDALYWEPGWKETDREIVYQRVDVLTRDLAWVTDGNYSFLRDVIWPRTQVIIWLDYSLFTILWRLWWRTWKRALTRELLWETNTERLLPQFFSRDSIFLWALQTYGLRKKTYSSLLSSPEYSHIKVYHFKSPRETKKWLSSLEIGSGKQA